MKKLPTGVLVLSILATFVGIMDLLYGLRMMGVVTFGPVESGNGVFLSGVLTFVVGLIWLGVGGALAALKPWGLMFVQIMAIFGLINAVFVMFGDRQYRDGPGTDDPAGLRVLVLEPPRDRGALRELREPLTGS